MLVFHTSQRKKGGGGLAWNKYPANNVEVTFSY